MPGNTGQVEVKACDAHFTCEISTCIFQGQVTRGGRRQGVRETKYQMRGNLGRSFEERVRVTTARNVFGPITS